MIEPKNAGAEVTYAWFEALDGNAKQRSELLAAKVPEHTVAALYPSADFDFAAAHLAARVTTIDIRALAAKKPITMSRRRLELIELLDMLPAGLKEAHAREINPASYQLDVQPLTDAFTDQFGSRPIGQTARSTYCYMLWHIWWFTGHREELTPKLRQQLDAFTRWVGENVLKFA